MVLPSRGRIPGVPGQFGNLSKSVADTLYPDKAATEAAIARVDPGTAGSARQYPVIGPSGTPAWRDIVIYDPRDFGDYVGDHVHDDTAAVQVTLAAMTNGGHLFLPGTPRITGTLTVATKHLTVVGTNRRNVQGAPSTWGMAAPSTIYKDFTGPLFKLSHTVQPNGFAVHDLSIVSTASIDATENICFDFDLGGNGLFMRDFTFTNVGVRGFYTVFMSRDTSTESGSSGSQIGSLNVQYCNITGNRYIAQCLNGNYWNGVRFHFNDAGNNGYGSGGGIHVRGHNVSICDNILEGQRDPVRIAEVSGRAVTIKRNYFEANVGDACIWVDTAPGPIDIGPNFYGNVSTTHKVLLGSGVGGGTCVDRWWPYKAAKVHPLPNAISGSSTQGDEMRLLPGEIAARQYFYLDAPRPEYRTPPRTAANIYTKDLTAPEPTVAPFPTPGVGHHMPVQSAVLASTGLVSFTNTYAATAGQIVVVSILFRRLDAPGSGGPYLQVRPNGSGVNGFDGYIGASLGRYFRDDEWVSLTYAQVLAADITTLDISLYAYGISATGVTGKRVQFRNPTLYTVADANEIRPFHANVFAGATSAPSAGTWAVGDEVYHPAPEAAGTYKWVCTTAGTPGTWTAVTVS